MYYLLAALLLPLVAAAFEGDPSSRGYDQKNCAEHIDREYECSEFYGSGSKSPKWDHLSSATCEKTVNRCHEEDHETCKKDCRKHLDLKRRENCMVCKQVLFKESPQPSSSSPSAIPVATPASSPSEMPVANPSAAPSSSFTNCKANNNCIDDAKRMDRLAETQNFQRRDIFETGRRDAASAIDSSISGAVKILNRLQSVADVSGTPADRANLASDQRLVARAQEAYGTSPHGSFTATDSKQARDPGVREELTYAAQNAQLMGEFKTESEKAQKAADEFRGLAFQNEQNVGRLASVDSAISALAETKGSRGSVNGAIPGSSPADVAATATQSGHATQGESARGAPAATAMVHGAASAVGSSHAQLGGHFTAAEESLRNRLRRELAAKALHEEALEGASFGANGLPPGPGANDAGKGATVAAAEDAVVTAFRGLRSSAGFALGSRADTEAEVRRLTRDQQESFPGPETATLFERVRRAHNSCQKRACVGFSKS